MFRQPTSSARRPALHHRRMPQHLLPTLIHTHNNRNTAPPKVSRHTSHLHTLLPNLLDTTRTLTRHLLHKTPTRARVKANPQFHRRQMSTSRLILTVVIPAMGMREEMPHPGIQELGTIMTLSTRRSHLVWDILLQPLLRTPV